MAGLEMDVAGPEDGPALVLIHSGGMAAAEWEAHVPAFARRFRVYTPDLPGHGRSLLRGGAPSIGDLAAALSEALSAHNITTAHLLGSSLGGAVALRLALDEPERVDRLVLYRVSYTKDASRYAHTRAIADPERWRRLGLAGWLSRLHEPQGGPQAWEGVIARVAEIMAPGRTDHDHRLERLAELRCETLIVVGDRDPVAPLEDAIAMYQTIPQAALYVLPDATHVTATNTWRRELFDTEVERFLRRGIRHPRAAREGP